MVIRMADGRSTAIDYRETAPARAARTMYLDKAGKVIPNLSLVGHRAVGVPGTVAGLELAQKRYGKLKWHDIVEPARRLAESGFIVTHGMANSLRREKSLSQFPESRRIFQKNGYYYKEGEIFKQPDLASTLKRIQVQGPREFYEGQTAKLLVREMADHGGLITMRDLQNYRPVERKPLRGVYRGYEVITMPPPSSGGIVLLEMLNILEHYNLTESGYNSSRTNHLLIEAMRLAFADRSEYMGDPDFVKIPTQGLIDKIYAHGLSKKINLQQAAPVGTIKHGNLLVPESYQTTHFSIVDGAGNAVSNTYTLNTGFGSGVTVKGAGLLLNNEMDDFTSKPGVPNVFGLIQGEKNAIAPRKRPLSSMTPTIIVKNNKLFLVIGSPGGPTIINTVLQVILNIIDHRMNLAQAIAAPRLHHQWLPDRINAESYALPKDVMNALKSMGHAFSADSGIPGVYWGDAEGVEIEMGSGGRLGASDPRSPDAGTIGY